MRLPNFSVFCRGSVNEKERAAPWRPKAVRRVVMPLSAAHLCRLEEGRDAGTRPASLRSARSIASFSM